MSDTYIADANNFPEVGDLNPDEGWINMRVQFLVDESNAGSESMVVGRTILPPGRSSHEHHRHHSAEEFVYIIRGKATVYNGDDEVAVGPRQIVFHPRGIWHGIRNDSDTEEVELLWAWGGAASRDQAGYEPRTGTV